MSRRRRRSCGRLSGFRWNCPVVWPLTWQSRQVTPNKLFAPIVVVDSSCGNGVNKRSPSSWTGVRMSRTAGIIVDQTTSPRDTSPSSGRSAETWRAETRAGRLRAVVHVKRQPRELDLHLREDLAAGGLLRMRQRQVESPFRESPRASSRPASPGNAVAQARLDPPDQFARDICASDGIAVKSQRLRDFAGPP